MAAVGPAAVAISIAVSRTVDEGRASTQASSGMVAGHDDEVGPTRPIGIGEAPDDLARPLSGACPGEDEVCSIEGRGPPARATVQQVGATRLEAIQGGSMGPDQQVVDPVLVDITDSRHVVARVADLDLALEQDVGELLDGSLSGPGRASGPTR